MELAHCDLVQSLIAAVPTFLSFHNMVKCERTIPSDCSQDHTSHDRAIDLGLSTAGTCLPSHQWISIHSSWPRGCSVEINGHSHLSHDVFLYFHVHPIEVPWNICASISQPCNAGIFRGPCNTSGRIRCGFHKGVVP